MKILGIESSCDDTSVALIEATPSGFVVLSEKTASQVDVHKKYGGVVPEIAGRKHAEKILPTVEEVLKDQPLPDAIAVTAGPGLMTGLLVGVEVAKGLSYLLDIPVIRTNHIEGHIYSVLLPNTKEENPDLVSLDAIKFPALCLIVSGGHTELILMKNHGEYELLGRTRDDAAGECFDKVAKLLDFDYPGGPKISKHALEGDTKAIDFPRPMMQDDTLDFSFSGLKTAALYRMRDYDDAVGDVCASFEQAAVDVLVSKTVKAAKLHKPKTVIMAGGVSANRKLRSTLKQTIAEFLPDVQFLIPPLKYCMDNATMIAAAGYFHAKDKDFTSWQNIEANPQWKLYE